MRRSRGAGNHPFTDTTTFPRVDPDSRCANAAAVSAILNTLSTRGGCGDWVAFSPSFRQCLYVVLITDRVAFALGHGQRSVCYRLPDPLRATALATGAVAAADIGDDWVRFELYRPDWPAPDLPFWTLKAYAAVRSAERIANDKNTAS